MKLQLPMVVTFWLIYPLLSVFPESLPHFSLSVLCTSQANYLHLKFCLRVFFWGNQTKTQTLCVLCARECVFVCFYEMCVLYPGICIIGPFYNVGRFGFFCTFFFSRLSDPCVCVYLFLLAVE